MNKIEPVSLEFNGVCLEPLSLAHADGLRAAARDGELRGEWPEIKSHLHHKLQRG